MSDQRVSEERAAAIAAEMRDVASKTGDRTSRLRLERWAEELEQVRSSLPPVRAEEPTARIDELAMWVLDGKKLPDSTVVSVGYWTADPSAMLGERFDAVVRTTLGDLRKQFAAALPPVQEPPKRYPECQHHKGCQWLGPENSICTACGRPTAPPQEPAASPSQGVRLDDLKALVETLRAKELARLRSTGVNADYSKAARHANAYLKALADVSAALEGAATKGGQ